MRFAVIRSRFNEPITQALLEGAKRGFADAKIAADLVDVFDVPGAFELPVGALWAAQTKKYNAIVCVGCVIRGDTPHFEYVAGCAARGIAEVALRTGTPVIFGVITVDTIKQARDRASVEAGSSRGHANGERRPNRGRSSNKGYDAARSAVAMAQLYRKLG